MSFPVVVAVLAASCGGGDVVMPTTSATTTVAPSSAAAELAVAQGVWRAAAPKVYTVRVDDAGVSTVLAVRDGESITLGGETEPATIDELFATIERAIAEGDEVEAEYDPTLGFPTNVAIDLDGDGSAEIDVVLTDLQAMPIVQSLEELLEARRLWDAAGLVDYSYVMRADCTCDDGGTWEVEVRSRTEVTSRALDAAAAASELSMTSLDRTFDDLEDWFSDNADLTADGLFAVDVRMDPELGYPRWFQLEAEGVGDGPFAERFTMVITIDSVTPLAPQQNALIPGEPDAEAALVAASEHWKRARLDDYTFVFTQHCECAAAVAGPMEVEVRNGSFVAAHSLVGGTRVDAGDVSVETIDEALSLVSLYLRQGKTIQVIYHPVLGHPMEAVLHIDAVAVDGGLAFTISDLQPAGRIGVIAGRVVAGPQCPVVSDPVPPECEDQPVGDAQLAMGETGWDELVPLPLASDGTFVVRTPPGDYRIVAQPDPRYPGTPAPSEFTIEAGQVVDVLMSYDTGIR